MAGRRKAKRVRLTAMLLSVFVGLAWLLLLVSGSYEQYTKAPLMNQAGRRAAPMWTRPCWVNPARAYNRIDCARVVGRIVWIERDDDDGDGDRHLVLVARLRPRLVKLEASFGVPRLPSLGARVEATGLTQIGSSGRTEITVERLAASGRITDRAVGRRGPDPSQGTP